MMADNPQQPAMFHELDLPRGNTEMEEDRQLPDFEKGISDDEGYQAAFDRSFPGPKFNRSLQSKGKKSPRRSDNEESPEPSPRFKKPRMLSLFGGEAATQTDENSDDGEMHLKTPKTPGQGIGMRLSSLTLEQQEEVVTEQLDYSADNTKGVSRPPLDIGADLDPSDRAESPALSEHSSKLDGDEYPLPLENPALSYGLRQNIDRTIAAPSWVDVDLSGNYDPEVEAKQKALKLNKAKAKKKRGMSI
jgi:hypothetical protein